MPLEVRDTVLLLVGTWQSFTDFFRLFYALLPLLHTQTRVYDTLLEFYVLLFPQNSTFSTSHTHTASLPLIFGAYLP